MLPHEILYLIYNAVYILPVLYVYFFGFTQGGAGQVIQFSDGIIEQMVLYYIVSILAFFAGSFFSSYGARKTQIRPLSHSITSIEKIIINAIVLCLLFTKILLYKEGVYNNYAFDSGAMSSKIWTVSMGLTELCVVFFIYCLVSGNKALAFFLFSCIASNLLHGTRIFTLICVLVYFFYYVFYIKKFSKKQIVIYGSLGCVVLLMAFLIIFIRRSDVDISLDNINLDIILSPVVYESIFNQISFVKMLDFMNHHMVPIAPQELIFDTFTFTLPSLEAVNKTLLMYPSSFGELSPLGGLSGYASAIIYFSDFYFLWYFMLGFGCSCLWRVFSHSNFPLLKRVLYVYFVCDTLFRLNRDPWYIVFKMLINNLSVIICILFMMAVIFRTQGKRAQQ